MRTDPIRQSYLSHPSLWRVGLLALLLGGGGFVDYGLCLPFGQGIGIAPVLAQSLRPEGAAYLIYPRLSFLPQENQYLRKDTGEVDQEHTLVSRFIRYNEDVKKRSSYRIDWQLTMADYLGANESIDVDRYPGSATLQINPAQADIAAINKLTLAQRQAFISLLEELYAPPPAEPAQIKKPPSPPPSTKPSRPSLTKPGDANLLLFP